MKKLLAKIIVVCACVFVFSLTAKAQKHDSPSTSGHDPVGVAVLKGTGKVAVIVVGSAAKIVYKTTKFVAKDLAKPIVVSVLKPVATKTIPAVAKFALKKSVKYLLPFAARLSLL